MHITYSLLNLCMKILIYKPRKVEYLIEKQVCKHICDVNLMFIDLVGQLL